VHGDVYFVVCLFTFTEHMCVHLNPPAYTLVIGVGFITSSPSQAELISMQNPAFIYIVLCQQLIYCGAVIRNHILDNFGGRCSKGEIEKCLCSRLEM